MLQRKLDKLGIERVEHNIWDDPADAEIVRAHARGNETVPTVVIGDRGFVNPSAGELVAYLSTAHPDLLPEGFEPPEPGLASRLAGKGAAEREGLLEPGGTIVEPTSGNTGVGLAIVAARRGYHCVFVCPDKVAPDKIAQLRAYGAEVVVCPTSVDPDHPESYYSVSDRLVRERPRAWKPDQYHNPNNPQAQYDTTGPEIWRQTAGRITHFVCGVGTGGTITGIGRYLKEQNPDIRVIGADPEGSVYSGGTGRPYLVEGIGEDFSSHDVVVVVHIPDSGRGYLSKLYDDDWMADHGFLRECEQCVGAVLDTRNASIENLLYVNPQQLVSEAIELMRSTGVSQLPVCKNTPPFAAAEVSGSIDELELMEAIHREPGVMSTPVEKVMGHKLPTIGVGQKLELAVEMLETAPALLVLSGGRPLSVLTRTDVLAYFSAVAEAALEGSSGTVSVDG
jgi:cystathionine beta-synthase